MIEACVSQRSTLLTWAPYAAGCDRKAITSLWSSMINDCPPSVSKVRDAGQREIA